MSDDVVQGAPGTTPGRWRAVGWSPRESDVRATVNGKSAQVCGPANKADAHQIAASPLMYAALVAAEDFLAAMPDSEAAQQIYEQAHAALAVAREKPHDP